jgi:hypothetical protein
MGRLTLNVLLSFAQFEREVIGERIRDKVAASKRKGIWMGGVLPLGYDVRERKLVVNHDQAETVRGIHERYLELDSVRLLGDDLRQRGIVSSARVSRSGNARGGKEFSRGALCHLLSNPIYLGEIRHKHQRHPGQHEALVSRELWERVQQRLRDQFTEGCSLPCSRALRPRAKLRCGMRRKRPPSIARTRAHAYRARAGICRPPASENFTVTGTLASRSKMSMYTVCSRPKNISAPIFTSRTIPTTARRFFSHCSNASIANTMAPTEIHGMAE